jgi:hypothetical protein
MKKQLRYKDEVRPSLWRFIPTVFEFFIAVFFTVFYISMNNMGDMAENVNLADVQKQKLAALILIICAVISIFIDIAKLSKRYKEYNRVKKERAAIRNYGVAHKGVVIDTEMDVQEETLRFRRKVFPVKRHYYYATIEFNDNGKKVIFKTPKLTDNPRFLNTKEMNVYIFNGAYYATDFGYIERPKRRIKDLFWWMEDDNGKNEKD